MMHQFSYICPYKLPEKPWMFYSYPGGEKTYNGYPYNVHGYPCLGG